ncbi:MAG: cell division protein FtsQ/DivIB [Nitrospinota bacterium]
MSAAGKTLARPRPRPRPRPRAGSQGPAAGKGRGRVLGRLVRLTLLLLSLAGGVLLGLLGHRWALESPWFQLGRVVVAGNSHLSEEEVLRLARLRRENLFQVDLDALRARLEAHPWVREARVSRLLPDALRVELTERRPVALVRAGSLLVVDGGGGVLGPARQPAGGSTLPEVTLRGAGELRPGQRLSRPDFLWSLRVARAFGKLGKGVRRGLRVEPQGEDSARAWARGGRWRVRLNEEDLEAQLARLAAVVPHLLRRVGESPVEVDLTFPGRVVVRKSKEGGERG